MRIVLTTAALALLAAPLGAQTPADPDRKVDGGGSLPAGWNARTDGNRPMTNVKFVTMGNGFHFTLGPAVIVWRESDDAPGAFHTEATFTQTKAPTHPEAYGLFFAGQDLSGGGQSYIYFLVRGDGKFLVKRRTGEETSSVSEGWTDHAAVTKQNEAGKATHKLEIAATADGKVSFSVNGTEVYTMTVQPAETGGIVGMRVNHNLDVHVEGFVVHKM